MPEMEKEANFLGAISRGTSDGLQLAINVGAMLISFIALLGSGGFPDRRRARLAGSPSFSVVPLQPGAVLWVIFAPVAWLVGVPWKDAPQIGYLLGTRMTINEVVAFAKLGQMRGSLDPRSFTIATFALCGFANFSSIGIQIGGIGALAPEQRGQWRSSGFAPCSLEPWPTSCLPASWESSHEPSEKGKRRQARRGVYSRGSGGKFSSEENKAAAENPRWCSAPD